MLIQSCTIPNTALCLTHAKTGRLVTDASAFGETIPFTKLSHCTAIGSKPIMQPNFFLDLDFTNKKKFCSSVLVSLLKLLFRKKKKNNKYTRFVV